MELKNGWARRPFSLNAPRLASQKRLVVLRPDFRRSHGVGLFRWSSAASLGHGALYRGTHSRAGEAAWAFLKGRVSEDRNQHNGWKGTEDVIRFWKKRVEVGKKIGWGAEKKWYIPLDFMPYAVLKNDCHPSHLNRTLRPRNVFDPAHPGTRVYGRGDAILRWDDQDCISDVAAFCAFFIHGAYICVYGVTKISLL